MWYSYLYKLKGSCYLMKLNINELKTVVEVDKIEVKQCDDSAFDVLIYRYDKLYIKLNVENEHEADRYLEMAVYGNAIDLYDEPFTFAE